MDYMDKFYVPDDSWMENMSSFAFLLYLITKRLIINLWKDLKKLGLNIDQLLVETC